MGVPARAELKFFGDKAMEGLKGMRINSPRGSIMIAFISATTA